MSSSPSGHILWPLLKLLPQPGRSSHLSDPQEPCQYPDQAPFSGPWPHPQTCHTPLQLPAYQSSSLHYTPCPSSCPSPCRQPHHARLFLTCMEEPGLNISRAQNYEKHTGTKVWISMDNRAGSSLPFPWRKFSNRNSLENIASYLKKKTTNNKPFCHI